MKEKLEYLKSRKMSRIPGMNEIGERGEMQSRQDIRRIVHTTGTQS
jgi:hypothetical protein